MCTVISLCMNFAVILGAQPPSPITANVVDGNSVAVLPQSSEAPRALLTAVVTEFKDNVATVEIFIRQAADLRGYELAVEISNEEGAQGVLEDVLIDIEREDFAFADLQPFTAVDHRGTGRLACVLLEGGVDADDPAYLGTFVIRIPENASGPFAVQVLGGDRTLLRDSEARPIKFAVGEPQFVMAPSALAPKVEKELPTDSPPPVVKDSDPEAPITAKPREHIQSP